MSQPARPYIRMNGAGNAFIVVQAFEEPFHPTADQVRALADPAAGLGGFDQLIGVEPSETADAFMRVWNADGSMVETCGNALRCVGWLLLQATDKEEVVIDTLGGPTTARRAAGRVGSGDPEGSTAATHQVTVDMARRASTGPRCRCRKTWTRAASSFRSDRSTPPCCTRRARCRWAIPTSSSSPTGWTTPSCAAPAPWSSTTPVPRGGQRRLR